MATDASAPDRSLRARLRRIIADWRDRRELSARALAEEYAVRHGLMIGRARLRVPGCARSSGLGSR
jgi:hypothetical protein